MSEAQREHLSAGIDGELAREELRFLLRRFEHDAELRQSWTRYHLARDGLRRQLPAVASSGFASRVEQAIAQELQAKGGRRAPHWLRWSAGGAIAASVAVAALMIARPAADDDRVTAGLAQASPTTEIAPVTEPTAPAAVPPWLSGDTASRYSQQAAATLGESYGEMLLPYARSLSPYRLQRVRSPSDEPGYFLLVDPRRAPAAHSRQAAAGAR
ncbi:sigma-E factor negative regulatory protein [Frateuria sp. STR12]|uniref:sigma-E factor negative regulatory protein n=1 Tax=Frateuria hangzhouensis TaxID=2995589 RepID=UPI002260A94B|nr:sigma-E factor negative regulatory protein [Frateuria sp. STR12]MCX7514924.1 sigma-E factor negative regulatory protein [Frateuria sp. STR12]